MDDFNKENGGRKSKLRGNIQHPTFNVEGIQKEKTGKRKQKATEGGNTEGETSDIQRPMSKVIGTTTRTRRHKVKTARKIQGLVELSPPKEMDMVLQNSELLF